MEHDQLYRDIEDCDKDRATKETTQHYASSSSSPNVKRLLSSRVPLYIIILSLAVALIIVSHRQPSCQDPSQMIYCRYPEHFQNIEGPLLTSPSTCAGCDQISG